MSLGGTVVLALQGLLGVAMAGAGGMKLAGAEQMIDDFERYDYPSWSRHVTGGLEVVAALGLFASFVTAPAVALGASLLVVAVMVGAIITHIRVGDDLSAMVPPAFLLLFALVVSVYHAGFLS